MNSNQNFRHRIAIIVCWYGPWPWYFKYFLHSVKYNPTVDFLLVTDEPLQTALPENVKAIHMSLTDVAALASEKMGFDVALKTSYKLCDYKPAYGDIFSSFLAGYHFWGHGDIDIIFGNIRNFIEPEIMDNFDVLSVHQDYIHGCFGIYRNHPKINTLYKCSRDFKKVFSTHDSYAFDECNGLNYFLTQGEKLENIPHEIESMTHLVKRMQRQGEVRAFFNFCLLEPLIGKIRWHNGTLTYNNEIETIAYHLYHFKKEPYLSIPPEEKAIGNYFYVGKNGVFITQPGAFSGFLQRIKASIKKSSYLVKFHLRWIARCRRASPTVVETKQEYLDNITGLYKNFNTNITILAKDNSIFVKANDEEETMMFRESDYRFIIKHQYLTVEFNKVVNDKPCFVTIDGKNIRHMYYKQLTNTA